MKKLFLLGAATTFTGTMAFIFSLVNHIQHPLTSSSDLLLTAGMICLGSLVISSIKCKRA